MACAVGVSAVGSGHLVAPFPARLRRAAGQVPDARSAPPGGDPVAAATLEGSRQPAQAVDDRPDMSSRPLTSRRRAHRRPPVAPVLGICLGGHPTDLPGFARSAFVSSSGSQRRRRGDRRVAHDYYRPSPGSAVRRLRSRARSQPQRPLLPLPDAQEYSSFDPGQEFSGIGVEVLPQHAGWLIARVFDALAGQARA